MLPKREERKPTGPALWGKKTELGKIDTNKTVVYLVDEKAAVTLFPESRSTRTQR